MLGGKKVTVVLPAYNASQTLEQTYAEIPMDIVDDVILVDDASKDETTAIARELGIYTIRHDHNRGYGGNQKTCYTAALDRGADVVVMLHPDYQYTPKLVTAMASMIVSEQFDVVLASRILGTGALAGGMPKYKYVSNRFLTLVQNWLVGQKLSEYHTGYRAWSRKVLETLPLLTCSDDFVFDNQMLAQADLFELPNWGDFLPHQVLSGSFLDQPAALDCVWVGCATNLLCIPVALSGAPPVIALPRSSGRGSASQWNKDVVRVDAESAATAIEKASRLEQIGRWILLLVAVVASAIALLIVYHTALAAIGGYFDVPLADGWPIVPMVGQVLAGQPVSWADFWSQANEHRIVFMRSVFIGDAMFFGGSNYLPLAVNWLSMLASATLLSAVAIASAARPWATKLLAVAAVVGCCFSGSQLEDILFPSGCMNLAQPVFVLGTFASIVWLRGRAAIALRFACPALLALLCTSCAANGPFIWPIAWVVAWMARVGQGFLLAWAALGIAVVTFYFIGYHSPSAHSDPLHALENPLLLAQYLLRFFACPFADLTLRPSEATAIGLLVLFGVAAVRSVARSGRSAGNDTVLIATGLFVIVTAMLTALGRVEFGPAQASSSRYATPVLILWSATLLLYLLPVRPVSHSTTLERSAAQGIRAIDWVPARVGFALAVLCALLLVERRGHWIRDLNAALIQAGNMRDGVPLDAVARDEGGTVKRTGIMLALGIDDAPRKTLGGVSQALVDYDMGILKQHNLSVYRTAAVVGLGKPIAQKFRVGEGSACLGSLDTVIAGGFPAREPDRA